MLELVRQTLRGTRSRARGLFRSSHLDGLFRDPNGHRSRGGANLLWQLALLELWLQEHEVPRHERRADAVLHQLRTA